MDDHELDAVIKLPSGTFKPYTGVSTAILLFTKTSSGGTDNVWFHDVQAEGFTLDDKRTPTEANDLPDALTRGPSLPEPNSPEAKRPRTAKSFLVREVEHDEVEHRDPAEILADLAALEREITDATAALARSLSAIR